jgi:HTH-type transcriptional regulator / antitoxin HigA
VDIHPIRNDKDHARALRQIEKLWGARAGTPEADTLEVLVTLVDAYEANHHPIDPPDPIDAIEFRMAQMGLERADLEPIIGTRARVSEVLNRRRRLTITMITKLRDKLGIPADVLIGPPRPPQRRKTRRSEIGSRRAAGRRRLHGRSLGSQSSTVLDPPHAALART